MSGDYYTMVAQLRGAVTLALSEGRDEQWQNMFTHSADAAADLDRMESLWEHSVVIGRPEQIRDTERAFEMTRIALRFVRTHVTKRDYRKAMGALRAAADASIAVEVRSEHVEVHSFPGAMK